MSVILEEDTIAVWDIKGQEAHEKMNLGHAVNVASSDPAAIGIQGHMKQITDMVEAIKYNRNPLVDIYDGRRAAELILAIYASARTGKMVELK